MKKEKKRIAWGTGILVDYSCIRSWL